MEMILFVLQEPWLSLMNNYWWVLVIVAVILAIRFFYYILLAIAFAIGFFILGMILEPFAVRFLPHNDFSLYTFICLCAVLSAYMTYRLHRFLTSPSTTEDLREIEDYERKKSRQKRINNMVEERAGVYCKNCRHYHSISRYDDFCGLGSHYFNAGQEGCNRFDLKDDLWDATYKEMKAEGAFET